MHGATVKMKWNYFTHSVI